MMKPKSILSQKPFNLLQRIMSRRNARLLSRLFLALLTILFVYTAVFLYLMKMEGQEHSTLTGLYWIISTMTTLGLGDVAFTGDMGRVFTIIVVCTGIFFFLALLPFTIFQLFQSTARIPRELPEGTRGHVVLAGYGPLTGALIERLKMYNQTYAVLVQDLDEAMQLQDMGIKTVAGEFDDPKTFREMRIGNAALFIATVSDISNTSLAYTVRQISWDIPIVATASSRGTGRILEKAGCTHVLALDEMMGESLARRIIAGDAMAHIIGQAGDLIIAEAAAAGTPLVGKTISQILSAGLFAARIIGIWTGGSFSFPDGDTIITSKTVLILAGMQEQIDGYNELFCIYNINSAPIIIIGGGSVGRALGSALKERGIDFKIIEKKRGQIPDGSNYITGDAVDADLMKKAGFFEAPAVAITTHSDQTNIYLTTFCRHLRNDIQIISRATLDRNIHTMQAAGCDFVISHASLGANNIFSLSKRGNILMIAEGVDVFRVKIPKSLAGRTIESASVEERCGCRVIGVHSGEKIMVDPHAETYLPEDGEIILIGTAESEEKFFKLYRPGK